MFESEESSSGCHGPFTAKLDPFGDNTEPMETEQEKLKTIALEYFGETDTNKTVAIQQFREKLKTVDPSLLTDLPGQNGDDFLLRVLRAGTKTGQTFNIENATQLLLNFTSMMASVPRYFAPAWEEGHKSLRKGYAQQAHTMLTHRDSQGRRVYIWRPGFWNPDVVGFDTVFACGYALMELIALEDKTQIAGVTSICDGSNFGYKQFKNFTFEDMKNAAKFGQVPAFIVLPLRTKILHIKKY